MRFSFRVVTDLADVTRNFEQIETAFGFPIFPAPPPNPTLGQAYYDTMLGKVGYWNSATWTYV